MSCVHLRLYILLELEFLREKGKVAFDSDGALSKLTAEVGISVCSLPFSAVIAAAFRESWTRDVFDRIVVAQAKANGMSPLITSDEAIRKHYARAVW